MCEIISGYTKPVCKTIGGIDYFIIYNMENRDSYTRVNNEVTALSLTAGKYGYKFKTDKELTSVGEVGTGNRENNTYFYAQNGTLILLDKTEANLDMLALLGQSTLGVIAVYESGLVRHFGFLNGMVVDTQTDASGTLYEDRNGHELAFSGKEKQIAPVMDLSIATALLQVVS